MSLNTYGDCFLTHLHQQGEYSGFVQANGKNFVKVDNKSLKHPLSNTNKLDNLVSISLREKVAGSTAFDTFRLYDIVDGELWFVANVGDNNYYNIFLLHLPDELILLPSTIAVNSVQSVDEVQNATVSTLAGRVAVLEGTIVSGLTQQQLGFIADVPTLKTEMDAVEAKNVVQDANIVIANGNIVAVNGRVDATNIVVAQNSANITTLMGAGGNYNFDARLDAIEIAVPLKAPIASPTFTGVVAGISKAMVGLTNVDDVSDANKPVSTAQQTALNLKANLASPTFTGVVSGITPTMLGLGSVDNVSDANKPVSTATQTALNLKANLNAPTFTGTVAGITKAMVGLANVDNIDDANKPVSVPQAQALALKADLASPIFTGVVAGITKAMVGLTNVDDVSDANKPVSTAQQTALNLKANLNAPTFTGTVAGITKAMVGLTNVDDVSDANKPVSTAQQTALNLKANLASPSFTGTSAFSGNVNISHLATLQTRDIVGNDALKLRSVVNGNIEIEPHGTGKVVITYANIPIGTGAGGIDPPIGALSGTLYKSTINALYVAI